MRNFAQKEQKLRTLCHPSQRSLVKRRPLARDLIGPNLAQNLMLGAAVFEKTLYHLLACAFGSTLGRAERNIKPNLFADFIP